jgi:cohesin complex subunit SCC1
MFYSQVILARKGPLGKIWLAAHFDKKLTKNQIFSTDISDSVESVLKSTNPLALRVSGHLMLGIVRIYNRKVKYLISDCTEAMWKIKLAFRPGNVNMLEAQFAILNQIDDQRYFGRINPDAEFPELEDAGYSEAMLANDATLKAARNRSLGSKHDTTQDYDNDRFNHSSKSFSSPSMLSNDELLIIPSFAYSNDKSKERKNTLSSKDSTVSSIEKARKITNLGRSENRLSYATAGTAMAMSFDDDIPAFEENIDLAINMADINIFPPPLNIEDINEPIHSMHSIDTSTLEVPLLPDDNEISLSDKVVNSATEFESTQEIMKEPRKARVVNPRKIKKQRVQVDVKHLVYFYYHKITISEHRWMRGWN